MKKVLVLVMAVALMFVLTACRQAEMVSYNVSKEADNFNVIRRISVFNMRSDKPLFELIGQVSIQNSGSNEIEVICQTGANEYKKHFIYLNDWTMYVIEDVSGADVTPYRYEVNFLPEMIVPVEFTSSY